MWTAVDGSYSISALAASPWCCVRAGFGGGRAESAEGLTSVRTGVMSETQVTAVRESREGGSSNPGDARTMRAFGVHAYGGEQVFFEVPVPNPEPGEVLVKVAGAGVGSWESMIASGEFPLLRPFPLALGLDFSGTVAAIGEGVSGFSQGDAVYAYDYPLANNSAFAEYVLVPADYLAPPPVSVGLVEAAAVPCAAVTAHKAVTELLDVREGEVVLITGGSGGSGIWPSRSLETLAPG
jgi:D-arabinose 1-dehydrogenase-like Zn-dependent alcohol dehydrogenase